MSKITDAIMNALDRIIEPMPMPPDEDGVLKAAREVLHMPRLDPDGIPYGKDGHVAAPDSERHSATERAVQHYTDAALTAKLWRAAEGAYYRLLCLGEYPGRNTMRGQDELSQLRDCIAEVTGRTAEEVQNEFEARATAFRFPPLTLQQQAEAQRAHVARGMGE